MKLISKEIIRNIKQMYLYIIVLILSAVFCFQILSSNQLRIDDRRALTDKNISANFIFKNLDKSKHIEILNKYKNINIYDIRYEYPQNFTVNKDFGENEISDYFYTIYNFKKSYQIYSGSLPDFDSNNLEVAIPLIHSLNNDIKIGDYIDINRLSLKVIGFTDFAGGHDAFVVSLNTAEKLNLKSVEAEINLTDDISKEKRLDIYSEINNLMGKNVYTKIDTSGGMQESIEKMYPIILIVLALSILNILFVYWNILNNRKKRYFIYNFLGIKKRQFYTMLLSETIAIYIFSFLIACILFITIDSVILKGIFGLNRYSLKLDFIVFVFSLFLVLLLIFTYFAIRKYFKKSVIELYKEKV